MGRARCWWRIWLSQCARSRKAAGSIPGGVNGTFYWHNPFGRTMALWSTRPLTEMGTRNSFWGVKAVGAYSWQPYHFHVPIVLKYGSHNLLEYSGPVQACNMIALSLPLHLIIKKKIVSLYIQPSSESYRMDRTNASFHFPLYRYGYQNTLGRVWDVNYMEDMREASWSQWLDVLHNVANRKSLKSWCFIT
jgi:hypothetical protein